MSRIQLLKFTSKQKESCPSRTWYDYLFLKSLPVKSVFLSLEWNFGTKIVISDDLLRRQCMFLPEERFSLRYYFLRYYFRNHWFKFNEIRAQLLNLLTSRHCCICHRAVRQRKVYVSKATAIDSVFDERWMIPNPSSSPHNECSGAKGYKTLTRSAVPVVRLFSFRITTIQI